MRVVSAYTSAQPHSAPLRTILQRLGLGAGLLALSACAGDQPSGPVEGVSLELAEVRAATISEVAYHFELEVPRALSAPVTGRSRTEFLWNDAEGRDVVLDFVDPAERVQSLQVNGESPAWQAVADHIVIPAAALQSGERNRIELEFTAGDEALNRSDDLLYTLFVPDRAHFSLPLFDQPDLKATVRLDLTAPEDWRAVANGPLLDLSAPDEGRWSFAETRPIPTYLIAFAVGRFEVEQAERAGRSFTMYHRESDPERVARNRDDIFDLVAASLEWMEEYTEIDYPFAKYDFVLLPSFQYGGMEHPGAVFYRQESLLLDPSAPQTSYLGRASLIAHETAHMWFGDLVTMKWFDDVWMKEVFANFFAAKIVHPSFPEVDHDLRFLLAHHPSAYAVDRTPGANAIRQPLENLNEAGTLYGPIIYQKAPIVMRQLEERTGEGTLRFSLRRYLSNHAYGNATWNDLIEIIAPRVPGDLRAWSDVWVSEPGRPVVELARVRDEDGRRRFDLRQSDSWVRGRVWPQRLSLMRMGRNIDGELSSRAIAQLSLDGPVAERVPWAGSTLPPWILPTGAGIEYGLFVLDDLSLLNLMADLPEVPRALDRGTAWLVIEDALLDDRVAVERVRLLALEMLEIERNELLIGHLLGLIDNLFWRWSSDEARTAWAPELEQVLLRGLERAESVSERALWFNAWRRTVTTSDGVERMRRIWARDDSVPGLPLSERDETRLAHELALRSVADAEAVLDIQRERIANPDRRAQFDFVRPAYAADESAREAFFASLAEVGNRAREPWVLQGLGALHHPLRRAHSERFVAPSLELLHEIQRTGDIFFPARWLGTTLENHRSAAVVEQVVRYLGGTRDLPPRLRAKVLQSADPVVRALRIVEGRSLQLPGPAAR